MLVKNGKILQANGTKKQTGLASLISEKTDFNPKLNKSNQEDHVIDIKERIHQG